MCVVTCLTKEIQARKIYWLGFSKEIKVLMNQRTSTQTSQGEIKAFNLPWEGNNKCQISIYTSF